MKKFVVCIMLIFSLVIAGCGGSTELKSEQSNKSKNNSGKEEYQVPDITEPVTIDQIEDDERKEKLKKLLASTAYAIGEEFTHNYFGDEGDGSLARKARRYEISQNFIEFHDLYYEELTNIEKHNQDLNNIHECYIKALNAMRPLRKVIDEDKKRYREKPQTEKLHETYELFSNFLTREYFIKFTKHNPEEKWKRFQEFIENGYRFERDQ